MPRKVAGGSLLHISRCDEKIRSQTLLTVVVVSSADATLNGRSDHARHGERDCTVGLQASHVGRFEISVGCSIERI